MKKYSLLTLLLILLCVLSGCSCKHEWTEANCTTAKTCSLCGEIEGEVPGHSWTPATCTAPETCERCGETQGEALGHIWHESTCQEPRNTCERCGKPGGTVTHNYGPWVIDGGTMSTECQDCYYTWTKDLDWDLYIRYNIAGFWDLMYYVEDDIAYEMAPDPIEPYVLIEKDGSFHLYINGETNYYTIEKTKRVATFDSTYYEITLTGNSGTATALVYEVTSEEYSMLMLLQTGDGGYLIYTMQSPAATRYMSCIWIGVADGNMETLILNDDGTFTADLGPRGQSSGVWRVDHIEIGDDSFHNSCIYVVLDDQDGNRTYYEAPFTCWDNDVEDSLVQQLGDNNDMITYRNDGTYTVYNQFYNEESIARYRQYMEEGSDMIVGNWTSAYAEYAYNNYERTEHSGYSAVFHADGTVTVIADRTYTGTWEFDGVSFSEDEQDSDVYYSYSVSVNNYQVGQGINPNNPEVAIYVGNTCFIFVPAEE